MRGKNEGTQDIIFKILKKHKHEGTQEQVKITNNVLKETED